ncbi:MAG: sulfur oxidation c-type cytochrome SoxX [Pseudomonadota bacterium]
MITTAFGIFAIAGASVGGAAFAGAVPPGDIAYEDGAVAASLTGVVGDAKAGRDWFADRKLGHCRACHPNSDPDDQSVHGEVGPGLDGVADRWSEAELRGIVSNAKMMFDGTIMPAFYREAGLNRVGETFAGKTILSAQQVEDIVAYLKTLKE